MEIRKVMLVTVSDVKKKVKNNIDYIINMVKKKKNISYDDSIDIPVEEVAIGYISDFYLCLSRERQDKVDFPPCSLIYGTKSLSYPKKAFEAELLRYVSLSEIEDLLNEYDRINLNEKYKELNIKIGRWMGKGNDDGLFDLKEASMEQEEEISNKLKSLYRKALKEGKDVLCVYYY